MTSFLTSFRSLITLKRSIFFATFLFGCAFAADSSGDSDVVRGIIQILDIVFGILVILLTPAIIIAGWLLSPDWTMGDFFGLRAYFLEVWVLVSNIVYIIFALLLLYMAVMNIFGGGEHKFAFKQKIGRFLIGILMVPFTWLIVSWTLSFANQAVAAVLSVPMGAIARMQDPTAPGEDKGMFHEKVIPTKLSFAMGSTSPGSDPAQVGCDESGNQRDGQGKCISAAEFVSYNQAGPFFIIMIYAYDIFKIQKTSLIELSNVCSSAATSENKGTTYQDSKTCVKNLMAVLRKFGVALVTTMFFAILLVALCWVLLVRAFKLWIYVMFSPLFGLAYAVGDEGAGKTLNSEGGGSGGASLGEFGFVPFFKLAMVPVLVSAVLSFGLLFVGVISNTFKGAIHGTPTAGVHCTTGDFLVKYCITADGQSEQGYTSRLIIGTDTTNAENGGGAGEYAITFEFGDMLSGFIGGAEKSSALGTGAAGVGGVASGLISSVEDIFAHIILTLISLVIIWLGVKAAVQHDEITRVAFEPFAKFGESVGHFVQHLPSHIPVPHPAFKALTPSGMTAVAESLRRSVDEHELNERKNLQDILKTPGLLNLDAAARNAATNVDGFTNALRNIPQGARVTAKALEAQRIALEEMVKASTIDAAKKTDIIRRIQGSQSQGELVQIIDSDLNSVFTDTKSQELFKVIKEGGQSSSSSTPATLRFSAASVQGNQIAFGSNRQVIDPTNPTIDKTKLTIDEKNDIRQAFGGNNPTNGVQAEDGLKKLFPDAILNDVNVRNNKLTLAQKLFEAAQP